MYRRIIYSILIILIILLNGCDKGISPLSPEEEHQKSGFSGKVTFNGNWPDSVQWTLLVVFKEPLTSASSFNVLNVGYISHPIQSGIRTYDFSTIQDSGYIPISAGTYSYIVVAQSNSPVLSISRGDWKVVGVYYANGDTTQPGKMTIPQNSVLNNINIKCDFNNPPPQPPGGN